MADSFPTSHYPRSAGEGRGKRRPSRHQPHGGNPRASFAGSTQYMPAVSPRHRDNSPMPDDSPPYNASGRGSNWSSNPSSYHTQQSQMHGYPLSYRQSNFTQSPPPTSQSQHFSQQSSSQGPGFPSQSYRPSASQFRGGHYNQSQDRRFSNSLSAPFNGGHQGPRRGSGQFHNMQWKPSSGGGRPRGPSMSSQRNDHFDDRMSLDFEGEAGEPFRSKDLHSMDDRDLRHHGDGDNLGGPGGSAGSGGGGGKNANLLPRKETGKISFAFKKTTSGPPPKAVPDLAERMREPPPRMGEVPQLRGPSPAPEERSHSRFDAHRQHHNNHRDDRRDSRRPDRRYDRYLDNSHKRQRDRRDEKFIEPRYDRRAPRHRDRDRGRDRDRVREREREREPERVRQRGKERERAQDRGRERERDLGRNQDQDQDLDLEPEPESEMGDHRSPNRKRPKVMLKRIKPRPTLPEDFAQSQSVYFRKSGNESVIGAGTYGKVFKAVHVYTKQKVALKKIRMEGEKDGFPVTAVREIRLLQSLRHENIVRLQEVMVENNECFMVFEYLSHDLTGLINHPTFHLAEAHKKHLAKQMFEGLGYLHHRGVLHRDIKAANILISSTGQLKFADFGLARFYSKSRQLDYTNRVITIWYRPPELLLGETRYGPEVDIWGAACVWVEMFTKKAVFPGEGGEISQLDKLFSVLGTPKRNVWPNIVEMPWFELLRPTVWKKRVLEDMYRDALSPAALDLVAKMLQYDPAKRPTADEVLQHPYFTTEQPPPRQVVELESITGDWHEFESKAHRKEQDKARRTEYLNQERDRKRVASGGSTTATGAGAGAGTGGPGSGKGHLSGQTTDITEQADRDSKRLKIDHDADLSHRQRSRPRLSPS